MADTAWRQVSNEAQSPFILRENRLTAMDDTLDKIVNAMADVRQAISEADVLNRWERVKEETKDAAHDIAVNAYSAALLKITAIVKNAN